MYAEAVNGTTRERIGSLARAGNDAPLATVVT